MNSQHRPRGAVIWNAHKQRWDWSAAVGGKTVTGHAATESDAWREMQMDWRVRGDQPRFVAGRLPRGGIRPPPPPL